MPSAPIPRIELALGPTPLLFLERLSEEVGVELWVKRDDLTGLAESGCKVRKLEFLVGEALAQEADTLITGGSPESSCCRTVSAVAARLGMRAVLLLRGDPSSLETPAALDGDYLLDRVLGAEIHVHDEAAGKLEDQHLWELAAMVRRRGGRPYVIPEAGATVTGALGYLACGQELAGQIQHGAPAFDTVVITAFSGGSHAGLLMAKSVTGLSAEIVSVPVTEDGAAVQESVVAIIDEARRRHGLPLHTPSTVRVIDGHQAHPASLGQGRDIETVLRVARREGLILDPIGTARAFGALLDTLAQDPKALGQRVCFVHTGSPFGLFPRREAIGRALAAEVRGES